MRGGYMNVKTYTRTELIEALREYEKATLLGGLSPIDMREVSRLSNLLNIANSSGQDHVISLSLSKTNFDDFRGSCEVETLPRRY